MTNSDFSKLSNDELIARVHRVYRRSRECTAELLQMLVEVEQRRLHLTSAHPSLFEFCVKEIGMSNSSAHRYSAAARLAYRHPQIIERIAKGQLHLSTLLVLRDQITDANADELLEAMRGKKRYEVEELKATLMPRPDAPSRMRKLPTPRTGNSVTPVDPQRLEPLAEARYRMQLTVSRALRDDIHHVRDLLRHSNPSGDLEAVVEYCVDAGLERLQNRRLGVVRQRSARTDGRDRARRPSSSKHVPRSVRRKVFERDGERCTYQDANGRRCSGTTLLELDHIVARAQGGLNTVENLRVRCRAHNGLHAEHVFGKEHVAARIRERKTACSPVGGVRKTKGADETGPAHHSETSDPANSRALGTAKAGQRK